MQIECRLVFEITPPSVVTRFQALVVIGMVVLLAPGQHALAQTEIHKCMADDGSVIYQQLPCAGEAAAKNDAPEPPQSVRPKQTSENRDESQESARPEPGAERRDTVQVAACRRRYRDAIDRIDVEIASGIPADEVEEYRGRARALSQALSRC